METEVWKDAEEFYQVSNLGRIKSIKRGKEKIMKGYINNYGYVTVTLNGKTKKVHQLVAIAFLNHIPCGSKLVVNHKNFIRHDNRLTNLEIITQRENANQSHLSSSSKFTGVFWNRFINKWQSKIRINGKNKHLGTFDCEEEASEYYIKALESIKNNTEIQVKINNK